MECLCRKGLAMIDLIEKREQEDGSASQASSSEEDAKSFENVILDGGEQKSKSTSPSHADVNQVYFDVSKLCKGDIMGEACNTTKDSSKLLAKFVERHALLIGHQGRAVKLLLKLISASPSPDASRQKLLEVLSNNPDYSHIRHFIERVKHAMYPKSYIIF